MANKKQIEIMDQLSITAEYLETNVTDCKTNIKIGFAKGEFLNNIGTGYVIYSGKLLLNINNSKRFTIVDGGLRSFDEPSEELYIRFDSDLFPRLNAWIDELQDGKEQKDAFETQLCKELEDLNETLKNE